MYADRPNINNVAPPPTHQLLTVENNLKTGFNKHLTPPEDKNDTIFFGSVLDDNSTKSNQQAGSSDNGSTKPGKFPLSGSKASAK